MPGSNDFVVDLDSERVWGVVTPGETVTATVNGIQMGAAVADGVGFFWTTLYDSSGDRPGLGIDDVVAIYADGSPQASVTIPGIDGSVDFLAEYVTGQISDTSFSVTVYARNRTLTDYWVATTLDPSGYYTADFSTVWDYKVWDNAIVAAVKDGVEVQFNIDAPAESLLVQPAPFHQAMGMSGDSGVVTVTLRNNGGSVITGEVLEVEPDSWWLWESETEFTQSDYVLAEFEGGTVISRTIDNLTVNLDAANNRLTGNTTPNTPVRGQATILTPEGQKQVQAGTTADVTGHYTIQFGVDITPLNWGGVFVADAKGEDLNLWTHDAFILASQTEDVVYGLSPSPPGESEGRQITLTFDTTGQQYVTTLDWNGWFDFNQDTHGDLPDIQPGEVITAEVEGYGWQGVVPIDAITATLDVDTDSITGEIVEPTDQVQVVGWHWSDWGWMQGLYPLAGTFDTLTTASSSFAATPPGFDIRGNDMVYVRHYVSEDAIDEAHGGTDYLRVWPDYNGTLGRINPPGGVFTLTLKNSGGIPKAAIQGTSDEFDGWIGWMSFNEAGEIMEYGDIVEVQSESGFDQEIQIPAFDVQLDLENDKVSGNLLPNTLLHVDVGPQGHGFVPTQANGDFDVIVDQFQEFYGDGDLKWGDGVQVCYVEETGSHVCVFRNQPSIVARYTTMDWNDVFGDSAIPGNPILITVTNQASEVVATGQTMAGDCEWCGPQQYNLEFPTGVITASNQVTVDFGDGLVDYMDVVTVSGEADVDTDWITVTVPPSSTIGFSVNNEWGDEGPGWDEIQVDISGVYSFDPNDHDWDVLPGDQFHVYVYGRHNHQTEYLFHIPKARLSIQKDGESGHPMPGRPYIYRIEYWNDAESAADNTIITDTLPAGTTYLDDTSGFPVEVDDRNITWTVGAVPSYSYNRFYVSIDVDSGVLLDSDLEANCAWISTTTFDEPDDNQSCSGEPHVQEGETGLWVDKWPEPADPHPGQAFQYVIEYGSDGGVATGPAWLTDTLPPGTSVVGWYDENDWDELWAEVPSAEDEFVLYAPVGVPGDMGGRIRLTLLLTDTAVMDEPLENRVTITTTLDDYPDNNEDFDDGAVVSAERYDLYIQKYVQQQVPIAGGWINYLIDFRNNGNVETNVIVTDTLPDDVSFVEAHWGGDQPFENEPLPDPTVIGNKLVWDLGALDVAESKRFHIQVDISDQLDPGASLENCVAIDSGQEDGNSEDNESCTTVVLNDPGPNLRVTKGHEWNPYPDRLRYEIHFENIGDETISNVWLTDTLPVSTTWEGWWDMDFEWDRLISEFQDPGQLVLEFSELNPGDRGTMYFAVQIDDPNQRPMWYTNTAEITIPPGDIQPGDNFWEDVAVLAEISNINLMVDTNRSNMWGESQPGKMITVTTPVSETYAFAEWDCGGCWDIEDAGPIWPGDQVTVVAGAGLMPVTFTVPDPFSAQADSDTDQVWGQIDHLDQEWVEVDLDGGPNNDVQTDDNGNYVTTFPDIARNGRGEVRYYEWVNYAEVRYHKAFRTQDLIIGVNYGHDWIEGNYEAGHTVWLTVTESDGATVKGTAQLTTGYLEDWDQPGFSTSDSDWGGEPPDILPGDYVFGSIDTGYETDVHVGTINGNIDVDTDSIVGTVDAGGWLPKPVYVQCHPWGAPGWAPQVEYGDLLPNNSDEYSCSWDPGSEWDIQPGEDLGVEYVEPDGDSVYNVFQEPASYLMIDKQGDGQPGEGGNYVFTIYYRNDGTGDAENVVITDTLQGNMAYLSDTSGFPHSGMNPVVWDLGTVTPGDWLQFQVFVEVTGSEGDSLTNIVQIGTSSFDQGEPEEKTAEWNGQIQPNGTDVNIGKDTETGDPAAGEPFIWTLNACNNGNTDSSSVILTDTLPAGAALQYWYAVNPGWTEESLDGVELVLSHPAIQGHRCETVYLNFEVDSSAYIGQLISNTATITASNDTDPGNNETTSEIWVSDPHTNLSTDKWWNWGQLVPGGVGNYMIQVSNNGNTTIDTILVTDTLPEQSGLINVWAYDRDWNYKGEVSLTTNDGAIAAWDADFLIPGDWVYFEIQIGFDPGIQVGKVITNSVEVSPQPQEDDYEDNYAEQVEEIYNHGANLRVVKTADWEDHGGNAPVAAYNLQVENIGDENVDQVVVTDYYPTALYFNGDIDSNYWRGWDWADYPDQKTFTVTLENLYPGESTNIRLYLITDTETIPGGLILTNEAQVTLPPGDTNPDDNADTAVLTTGPDMYVYKDWVGEEPAVGEEGVFEIRFGNAQPENHWWWNMTGETWITDTLPTGLEFVTSHLSWCPWIPEEWCEYLPNVNGNDLGWQLYGMNTGEEQVILLTVRVSETASPGDIFGNLVVIEADQPEENIDPDYGNNSDTAEVYVFSKLYLPLIFK